MTCQSISLASIGTTALGGATRCEAECLKLTSRASSYILKPSNTLETGDQSCGSTCRDAQKSPSPLCSVLSAQMDAEKAFVDGAAEEGRIVVHPTTCYGVRECGGSENFDQSCHWGTDGRYVCLRYAPLS